MQCVFALSVPIYFLRRCDAFNSYFAFQQIFSMCVLKLHVSSIVILSRTTFWDFSILFPNRNRFTLMSIFVPNIMNWNLPGFGFNEFTLNHFKIFLQSNLRLCKMPPNVFLQELNVLSSAKSHMSDFDAKENMLFTKLLNNKGPRIDPCGIPQVTKAATYSSLCFWLLR